MPPAPRPQVDVAGVPLDASLQRWIVEQRLRGCTVASLLDVMEKAGHAREAARRAIGALERHPAYAVAQAVQQRQRKLEAVALNLQRLWASDPHYRAVDKRAELSEAEFAERYVRGCRPVVLTGHTHDWPAMRTWSPADLKRRLGHLEVDIQAERNADDAYEENKLLLRRRVNLGVFVDQVLQGGVTNDYYLTANSEVLRRPEFASLLDDIGTLPPLADRAQLAERSSFWFGPAGTVTPLHHDTLMLFHTQVVGRKRWRFVSPLEWPRLYNARHVFSEVDLERPDSVRFPAFAEATVLEVVVEPGETMFLPLGWWHQVTALDVSLSFSYSCLSVENQFDYPDPAFLPPPAATLNTTSEEVREGLVNAVAPDSDVVEAQFADGSALRFSPTPDGFEVSATAPGSRAAQCGEQLAGVARTGDGIECHFKDGSSLRIVPFHAAPR